MATYYVKLTGGTGSGLDDANAWSLAKFTSMQASLVGSDTILFKRGDVYYVKLQSEGTGLTYGDYSTGTFPVISGFTQLSSWTVSSGNIYYATLDVSFLNLITYNDVPKPMGRYPKSGYLQYTSHTTNTAITGTDVGAIPFNPAGAEVVIRKERFIIDRHFVSSRSGNTLNYTAANEFGNNSNYSPLDNNGFFIQNHLSTLTQEGDWYYDKTAKRLYVHFGVGTPSGKTIKATTLDKNIQINSVSNITCNNLIFEGANEFGAWNIGAVGVTFNNCSWRNQGGNHVYGGNCQNINILGGTMTDSLNGGVMFEYSADNVTINGVNINNSGIYAGSGKSGDAQQCAVFVAGISPTVANCIITNSGYNAIDWTGNSGLIERNFIDTFCTIKDDGGGIYNFIGLNGIIRDNIILNSVGAYEGAHYGYWEPFGKSAGIYLDNGADTHTTTITRNFIYKSNWAGIFINNNAGNTVTYNTTYDCRYGLLLTDFNNKMRTLTLNNNKFIAANDLQFCFRLDMGSDDTLSSLGTFTNNLYARPTVDTNTFSIYRNYAGASFSITNITLAAWQSTYSQDAGSSKMSATEIDPTNVLVTYNFTNTPAVSALSDIRKDVSNAIYSTSQSIPAYSGSILFKTLDMKCLFRNGKVLARGGKVLTVYN